ncbi:MAG: NAD(P)H-dependent oxidoreductase subunit E [Candidatus Tenebribacter burtonii]|nr:NAD(P)H-dependent oxidoreductase subunit E [Candidatus Tenebribacter burtonii]
MANNSPAKNLLYQKLQEVIDEKKGLQNPLIEILHQAQGIFGYLPAEVQQYIAEQMNIPIGKIYGVVTFYNFFSMEPRGKHVINVCTGTACYVKGAPKVIQMFEEELSIKMGETTKDGLFTLTSVRCVGACSLAPVFVIDNETYGRVDARKKLVKILDTYR